MTYHSATTAAAVDDFFDPFALNVEKDFPSDFPEQSGQSSRPSELLSASDLLLYSSGDDRFSFEGIALEDFDPFGIAATAQQQHQQRQHQNGEDSSTQSPNPPPEVFRLTRSGGVSHVSSSLSDTVRRQSGVPLPPKLMIRFIIHEEVSSVAIGKEDSQGASEITAEGSVKAQVQSSDALKNSPFALEASTNPEWSANLQLNMNEDFVTKPNGPTMQTIVSPSVHIVHIPKSEIASVNLGSYSMFEVIKHMPLLVERKVTIQRNLCRIAVQVRSKLTNAGNLKDFTIAVAIPECINGDTVESSRGEGVYDDLKRTIKWKVAELPKGESVMVCAQAQLWTSISDSERERIRFPVLLRCISEVDRVSSVDLRAIEADGFPAVVSFSKVHSFRLIHRLL